MSQPAPNTTLTVSARLLCYLGPPSAILLTAVASPKTALLSPGAFLPTLWFYQRWQRSNNEDPTRRGELASMVWIYAAMSTLGITSVALLQMGAVRLVSPLLFRSETTRKAFWQEFSRATVTGLTSKELAQRAQLAAGWQNWVFNGVLAFIMAGLFEEMLKFLPVAYARYQGTPERRQHRDGAYLDYALAGALGFGVVENIGFFYTVCEQAQETWPKLALTVFERMFLGSLGHLLLATLTALRAIRRDYYGDRMKWWAVIGPSVLLHGLHDFGAMTFSALGGNVGWVHPVEVRNIVVMLGLGTGLFATTAWQVWKEFEKLDKRDKKRQ